MRPTMRLRRSALAIPVVIPVEDEGTIHGNNERISVENVRRGVTMMWEIARRVAAK